MKAKNLTKETVRDVGVAPRNFPKFDVGDRIAVSVRIKEGDKERLQVFEGDVIAMKNNGISSTFTVRKMSTNAVAVERIFPYYAPIIADIKFVRKGKVRRAKLYYVRDRVGKAARITEDRLYKVRESEPESQEIGMPAATAQVTDSEKTV